MNTNYTITDILEVRSILKQIYKNIRMLIRNNPTMRATLNLETKDGGIYITDIGMGIIDKMVEFCESNQYTTRKLYILVQELNNFEMLIKDILQYFHYFIRPDFRQKPDIEMATEKYKEIADKRTIQELKELVGKSHRINFEGLGSSRLDITDEIEYDENVDGTDKEEDKEDELEIEKEESET